MIGDRPTAFLIGGINGAGKTTLAGRVSRLSGLGRVQFLDSDKITGEILAAHPEMTRTVANFAGLRVVSEAMTRCLENGQSFVAETVLASTACRRICLDAKSRGWAVRLFFVGVPTVEDSIARVALRVAKGGHDVPEADIRRRWPRTHENLAWFAHHADAVDVFANSLHGVPPVLVARARAGRVELLDASALPAVTEDLRPLVS